MYGVKGREGERRTRLEALFPKSRCKWLANTASTYFGWGLSPTDVETVDSCRMQPLVTAIGLANFSGELQKVNTDKAILRNDSNRVKKGKKKRCTTFVKMRMQ